VLEQAVSQEETMTANVARKKQLRRNFITL
jgi:hypothetical protein